MESLERYFPFWPRLSTALQNRLQSAARERHFAKSEPIRGGEDGCLGLLLVKFGQLRVFTVSAEGKELTLYRLLPGDLCLFSASCILPGIRFDVLLSAEQDTTVLQIPAQVYRSLMQESAAVANYTSELMAAHFSDVMWLMDQILNQKLDSRLAALLLEESELISSDTLTVTHEQLANHLGSPRETITRMLRYFQNEGLVRLGRGKMVLTGRRQLLILAQNSRR